MGKRKSQHTPEYRRLLQALRQRKAADAAADDEDVEGFGHFELLSRRTEVSVPNLCDRAQWSRGAFAANLWLRA